MHLYERTKLIGFVRSGVLLRGYNRLDIIRTKNTRITDILTNSD